MKTSAKIVCLAVAVCTCQGGQSFGQPASIPGDTLINPQNGLPPAVAPSDNPPTIVSPPDPAHNLPFAEPESIRLQKERDRVRTEQERQDTRIHDPEMLSKLENLCSTDSIARRRLTAIRDEDARVFFANADNLNLFAELYAVNHALGDDGATLTLFLSVAGSNPSKAGVYESVIEAMLIERGEYELCYQTMGNPESRFRTDCFTFRKISSTQQFVADRSDEVWRNLQATNQWPGGHRPYVPPHMNMRKFALRNTRDFFVHQVCNLILILVATGHMEEAERIRGEAVALLDDPRLQSAITQAEAHLKNPAATDTTAAPTATPLAAPLPPPAVIPPPAFLTPPRAPINRGIIKPAIIDPATGQPESESAPTGPLDYTTGLPVAIPADRARANPQSEAIAASVFKSAAPLLDKINGWPYGETYPLYLGGHYAEVLDRLILYRRQFDQGSPMSLLILWHELTRKYPPAQDALTALRDQDVAEFSAGGGNAGLFLETTLLNAFLNQSDGNCALFDRIYERDPQLAAACYPTAEQDLVHHGEYALCLKFYTGLHYPSPQQYFDTIRTNVATMQDHEKAAREHAEKLESERRQHIAEQEQREQQFQQDVTARLAQARQEAWDRSRANLPDNMAMDWPTNPPSLPAPSPPELAKLPSRPKPPVMPAPLKAARIPSPYVMRVRALVEILEGTGHQAEAERIRDEAVAVLDDPLLESAVSDAENRIKNYGAVPLPGK